MTAIPTQPHSAILNACPRFVSLREAGLDLSPARAFERHAREALHADIEQRAIEDTATLSVRARLASFTYGLISGLILSGAVIILGVYA